MIILDELPKRSFVARALTRGVIGYSSVSQLESLKHLSRMTNVSLDT